MKVYIWNSFEAANAFCLRIHWFAFTTRTPEIISNLIGVFFWIWLFFLWAVFFHVLFWNTGFVHVWLQLNKVRHVFIIWSFTFWVPLFSSSEALFISSDFDIFIMKLILSSKFVLSFLSLLDILYEKAHSTIFFFFLNAMMSMIRKRLITFYFK